MPMLALMPMLTSMLTLTLMLMLSLSFRCLQDFEGQRAVEQISRNGLLALTVRLFPPSPLPSLFRRHADGMLLGAVRAVRCDVCGAQAVSYVLGLALQSLRVTFGVFGLGVAVLLLVRAVSPSHRHQPLLRLETDVLSPSFLSPVTCVRVTAIRRGASGMARRRVDACVRGRQVAVPQWPAYNKHPVRWLPKVEAKKTR